MTKYIVKTHDAYYTCEDLDHVRRLFSWYVDPVDMVRGSAIRIICNGKAGSVLYSDDWDVDDAILDYIKCYLTKEHPNTTIYKVEKTL